MLQRGRLVVPFGVVAHARRDVDSRMYPLRCAVAALVGFQDIAADDIDRHPVAPGVVYRHGGVLQADHTVTDHGERLAFHLGVAVAHRHGDFLVRASEDFRLEVLAVVDDGFVEATEARRAIHREIVDVERLEHVDHKVAAAGGLGLRVLLWRRGLERGLDRPGCGSLEIGTGRRDLRGGGDRRHRSGARQSRAFEEFAAIRIRQRAAFRHDSPRAAWFPTGDVSWWEWRYSARRPIRSRPTAEIAPVKICTPASQRLRSAISVSDPASAGTHRWMPVSR